MAANGISTLATKELRQKAKLDLAASDRAADGNPRSTYDITQLPTQYDGNNIIDNANTGGLILGRPWIDGGGASLYNPGLWLRTYTGYFNDDPMWFQTASGNFGIADTTLAGGASIPTTTSIEWQGYFLPESTGTYTFGTTSDDASYIWVGNNAISGYTTINSLVNNGGLHGPTEVTATISLTAGVYYPIRIQAGNNAVTGTCIVQITGPSTVTLSDQLFYKEIVLGI
jgi:hypothetical protein